MLAMAVLYNKCWCFLRIDYIRQNLLSYLSPLLWPFTSIVWGGCQYYVFLLTCYVISRRNWIIRAVHSLLPAWTYPRWYTRLPVVYLDTQVTRGSLDTVPRAEVLTYEKYVCCWECGIHTLVGFMFTPFHFYMDQQFHQTRMDVCPWVLMY